MSSTAPLDGFQGQRFRVTHPFHPLHGRELPLLDLRQVWGESRVYYPDDEGTLSRMPAAWTDTGDVDPFAQLSGGRSFFRPLDLLALADLLGRLESGQKDGGL